MNINTQKQITTPCTMLDASLPGVKSSQNEIRRDINPPKIHTLVNTFNMRYYQRIIKDFNHTYMTTIMINNISYVPPYTLFYNVHEVPSLTQYKLNFPFLGVACTFI